MSDNAELHNKIMTFLSGEFARKEGRQCDAVDLDFEPGNGFRPENIRKWVRADDPEFFDNFSKLEQLVTSIIDIAEGEVNAKPAGKHCFVIRTHQHLGNRAKMSFALQPQYNGSNDETALVPNGVGGGRGESGVIANHAGQLMRINAQMFEGTIRVLGAQNMNLHEQVATLTAENATLRKELEEARSNRMDRDFQLAMAAEKNARTNAGFQKLLQLGTVVAAKIGGGEEAQGSASPLAMLIGEFYKSLRPEQMNAMVGMLDMAQKIMFVEIVNLVNPDTPQPQQQPGLQSGSSASTPPSGTTGAP